MRVNDDKARSTRTALDALIGYFSPRAEVNRIKARLALQHLRKYEGASGGRRTKNWRAPSSSANAEITSSLPTLMARSRQLCRDNPWMRRAVNVIATNTVGTGIIPQTKGSDKRLVDTLEGLWIDWADEVLVDSDGRLDFYGLQSLVMKTVAESGSCLVRRRWRLAKDGLPVPLQLQVLEPDYLDTNQDKILPGGGRIVQGIEYDAIGRRVAYWLYADHPGNSGIYSSRYDSRRVPADDVIHVYRSDRPGQVTGVPWAAPVLLRVRDLDEFEDAELIRQKIAACFAIFIHDIETPEDLGGTNPTQAQEDRRDELSRVEPGIMEYLPPGKDVKFGQPPQTAGYDPHTRSVLRSIAAGFGITYEALTGDYSQVNFSSGRMGWIEMSRNIEEWRSQMLLPQFCKTTWRWFNEAAVIGGKASGYAPASWTSPRREMIDPVKETSALKDQVRNGFISWDEAIRQGGRDPEEVAAEIKKAQERFDELGLVLDCDARRGAGTVASKDDVDDAEKSKAAG